MGSSGASTAGTGFGVWEVEILGWDWDFGTVVFWDGILRWEIPQTPLTSGQPQVVHHRQENFPIPFFLLRCPLHCQLVQLQ